MDHSPAAAVPLPLPPHVFPPAMNTHRPPSPSPSSSIQPSSSSSSSSCSFCYPSLPSPLPSSSSPILLPFSSPYKPSSSSMSDDCDSWTCTACTSPNPDSLDSCSMCYTQRSPLSGFFSFHNRSPLSICAVSTFLSNVVAGALTGTFALVGAFSGAITGAIASRAASSGLLRGAGLGAVAGAVLSVEVLEASRTYWNSQRIGGSGAPSMGDFLEDLLNGRFIQEFVAPAVSATQQWQMNFAEMSYEELYEMFVPSEGRLKGASEELLKSLPQHVVTQCNKINDCGDVMCCAICLQELEQGDIARALPMCNHTFHLSCVDRWLVRHTICPVCRQYVH